MSPIMIVPIMNPPLVACRPRRASASGRVVDSAAFEREGLQFLGKLNCLRASRAGQRLSLVARREYLQESDAELMMKALIGLNHIAIEPRRFHVATSLAQLDELRVARERDCFACELPRGDALDIGRERREKAVYGAHPGGERIPRGGIVAERAEPLFDEPVVARLVARLAREGELERSARRGGHPERRDFARLDFVF